MGGASPGPNCTNLDTAHPSRMSVRTYMLVLRMHVRAMKPALQAQKGPEASRSEVLMPSFTNSFVNFFANSSSGSPTRSFIDVAMAFNLQTVFCHSISGRILSTNSNA